GAYARRAELDAALRQKFQRMAELRGEVDAADRQKTALEQEQQEVVGEQKRIRDNLAAVASGTDLHKRYLDTLRRQEDRLDKLEGDIRAARDRTRKAKDALTEYVQTTTL